MLFLEYSRCGTTKKARKWLEAHGLEFDARDIKEENPTESELRQWHTKSGLPLKAFFNTNGAIYKEMKLKETLPSMSDDEQFKLLATDGMLVKRPILVADDFVLVGFKEEQWQEKLL